MPYAEERWRTARRASASIEDAPSSRYWMSLREKGSASCAARSSLGGGRAARASPFGQIDGMGANGLSGDGTAGRSLHDHCGVVELEADCGIAATSEGGWPEGLAGGS